MKTIANSAIGTDMAPDMVMLYTLDKNFKHIPGLKKFP